MPKVVPSEVVALIDRTFPHARSQPQFPVYTGHAGTLSAIVSLIDEIPNELLRISGEDYVDLVHARATLAHTMERWKLGGSTEEPPKIKGKSPVAIIRDALSKCPDQSPSTTTATLTFISDPALRDSIRVDISDANGSLHTGEWKAATVLAAAAVEALLLWAIQRPTVQPVVGALAAKPAGQPDHWNLSQFIDVAEALNFIKRDTATQARLAKDFRNLIHPGRTQRTAQSCDRGTALTALAAVELAVRDLK
jgi:hypothetical protein